jgi:hypothetical protein
LRCGNIIGGFGERNFSVMFKMSRRFLFIIRKLQLLTLCGRHVPGVFKLFVLHELQCWNVLVNVGGDGLWNVLHLHCWLLLICGVGILQRMQRGNVSLDNWSDKLRFVRERAVFHPWFPVLSELCCWNLLRSQFRTMRKLCGR